MASLADVLELFRSPGTMAFLEVVLPCSGQLSANRIRCEIPSAVRSCNGARLFCSPQKNQT